MTRPWLEKLRLRVLALVAAVAIMAWGAISLAALPALPVIGVAVAGVTLVVNLMTSRLARTTCLGCGTDLASEPPGEHGVICPSCGTISLSFRSQGHASWNATADGYGGDESDRDADDETAA